MSSNYNKPIQNSDRFQRSVFVGNISYDVPEDTIRTMFSQVGTVISLKMVHDRETGKPKGYGFIEYPEVQMAESAIRNLNGHELSGRPLRVDNAADLINTMEEFNSVHDSDEVMISNSTVIIPTRTEMTLAHREKSSTMKPLHLQGGAKGPFPIAQTPFNIPSSTSLPPQQVHSKPLQPVLPQQYNNYPKPGGPPQHPHQQFQGGLPMQQEPPQQPPQQQQQNPPRKPELSGEESLMLMEIAGEF